MQYLILTLSGMLLGSFYNMLIYRLPRQLKFAFNRSYCPQCEHTLNVVDLIPIFSYLSQLGKCRYCKKKIPVRYLLVELMTAALLIFLWVQFGNTLNFYKYFLFLSGMLIIFFADLETCIIPDSINIGLLLSGLAFAFFTHDLKFNLIASAGGFFIFLIISGLAYLYYKKEALGGGDIKLGAAIGAFWGIKITIISIYLSFIVGGIIAIGLILAKIKKKTDYIPFAPAIIMATIITLIYGERIWRFYFG
ncbi:prepilin peptidase [Candidatus Margulisiibacteriota bacterium]